MILKEETKRMNQVEESLEKNHVTSNFSCELAEEFLAFERENIQILKAYIQ